MPRLIDADRLETLVQATLYRILENMPEDNETLYASTVAAFETFGEMIRLAPTVKETKKEK